MPSFARSITEAFAEQEAVTPKEKVIKDLRVAIGSCVIAIEEEQLGSAREIYGQLLVDKGIEPTGVVDTDNWQQTVRMLGANLGDTESMYQILASLGMWDNPLVNTCRLSHPSMGDARPTPSD
jgi:hypothetical protein